MMKNEHKFQVNLRGVIDLLSHHLYSGPQVYLRELMQNGVDAITARQRHEPDHVGEIKLNVVPGAAGNPITLSMYDNGVGLTEDEVHQFLATIGRSSKRDAVSPEDFIGQFGIGLLSGFVVSDEVIVFTRSIQPGARTVKWIGRADGTYEIETLDNDFSPGTEVYLRAKPGCGEFLEADYVRETATHFGSLLPFPITVSSGRESVTINEEPPWRESFANPQLQQQAYLEYGEQLFGHQFLDAIPLKSEVGDVDGIAYVLPHAASLAAKKTHRVYLKNMLLSEQAEGLLPDWAFFVKCVLNVNDLRPTAARESFYEDDALDECRAMLGRSLRDYLTDLAATDRDRLDRLIDLHFLAIKSLAAEDDDFFRIFINWLPFETSLGTMTLEECSKLADTIRYVSTRDEFRQIAPVASAQNLCIVNAGYVYDKDLLQKLSLLTTREVEHFDITDLSHEFADLSLKEREQVFELIKLADVVLQPYRCRVAIKKFVPVELASLYTTNDSASFLRSIEQSKDVADDLWGSILDRVAEQPAQDASAELCLNFSNPLVSRLAKLTRKDLVQRAIEMLYVQSLLLGHFPLKAAEQRLLTDGLLGLIELGITSAEQDPENKD